ncbi:bifunctional glycosyltransferase/CDP-glycerol:glycerophosphate glycerophosphotransferase [Photobacterium damselae]|uniref:bifunctional glycosyltransferase/CDP-glycerol:glycerophosphate glycerophosphotransferase n=1 Tax=Photobacterium damselae TaxID=38293 RepID=UPI0015936912|nr:CDP-glycerol glycerophosphotransferase family protein [Photobacterium damselae]NVH47131.1 CDP-glycerol glycerophosphotransferase family protein [Photobacterium damselae subsp. damselae]
MKISIIITLYNRANIVDKAIESALKQDYNNKEIIIVNDGSTDNYEDALAPYKDQVIIYTQENKGCAGAKNKGVELATGEYIIFLDSDDTFYSDSVLTDCYKEIATGSQFVGYSQAEMIRSGVGPSIEKANFSSSINIQKHMLESPLNYAAFPPMCLNKRIYQQVGGMQEKIRWGDAINFWRYYFSHVDKISYIHKPGYSYNLTGDDNMSKASDKSVKEKFKMMTDVIDEAFNNHKSKMSPSDQSTWLLILYLYSLKSNNKTQQKNYFSQLKTKSLFNISKSFLYLLNSKVIPKLINKLSAITLKIKKKNIFNGCISSLLVKRDQLDPNTIIINSTVNKNFNFNSKYFFEYLENEQHGFNVYFIVNNDKTRNELNKKYPGKFITNYLSHDIKIISKAKTWLCSTLDLPIYFCFKHPDRIVYHFGHGVPLKNIGLNEPKISIPRYINRYKNIRCFTHVTCYSKEFQNKMEKMFGGLKAEYLPLGQPRNDSISQSSSHKPISSFFDHDLDIEKYVLYSPTWRYDSTTKFFPFSDFDVQKLHQYLDESNTVLILREHPFYPAIMPDGLCDHSRVKNLSSKVISDFTPYILDMDTIITDYSSLYLDGLSNPKTNFIFIPYDIENYTKLTGFSMPYEELTPGPKALSFEAFIQALENNDDQNYGIQKRELAELFNVKYSGNCHEHFEYIKNLLK